LGCRPPWRPWARAERRPAWVRSRTMVRSNSAVCDAPHNEERFWLGGAAHECRCRPSAMEAAPVSQKRVGLNRCPELAMGIVATRSLAADRRDPRFLACGLTQPQGSRRPGSGWWARGVVHQAVLASLR
jgi:hypothetical protein